MLSGTWRKGWSCFAPRLRPSCHCHAAHRGYVTATARRLSGPDTRRLAQRLKEDEGQLKGRTTTSKRPQKGKSSFFFSDNRGDVLSKAQEKFEDLEELDEDVEAAETDEDGYQWTTEDVRDKFLKEDEERKREEEQERRKSVDELLKNLDPLQKHLMKKFAFRLELAQKHPKKYDKEVWYYFRIIMQEPKCMEVLGDLTWVYMWKLETQDVPLRRRIDLVETMLKLGVELSEKHAIGYIEALFWHGERDKAMMAWESQLQEVDSLRWWNLGVKMFATEQDPKTAERVADDAVKKLGSANAMTYTPVIISYHNMIEASGARKGSAQAIVYNKEAMRTYLKLKQAAGANMTAEEYLRIASSFLDANFARSGLTVYEDMIYQIPDAFDTLSKRAVEKVIEDLEKAQDETLGSLIKLRYKWKEFKSGNLEWVTERIMRLLPENQRYKIMCGNWVRNLAKLGKVDAAMRVMQKVRQELNIIPRTGSYNALLGAMLQTGRTNQFHKLSYTMIKQAADRVRPLHKGGASLEEVTADYKIETWLKTIFADKPLSDPTRKDAHLHSNERSPEYLMNVTLQSAPYANIATFEMCYRYCAMSQSFHKLKSLLDLMAFCKIEATINFFTRMLRTLLKSQELPEIWNAFTARRRLLGDKFKPIYGTYKVLWKGMFLQRFSFKPRTDYATPRELFRLMHEDNVVPQRLRIDGIDKYDRTLYNLIIKSFFKHGDLLGGFVALNACYSLWGIAPGVISIGNLIKGCGRVRSFDHHIGAATHRQTYRAVRSRAAEWFGTWAGPPLEKPKSFRQKKWAWRLKRWKDWKEVVKDLPVHERPYYKYAPTEKDLPKEGQNIDDPDQRLVRQLGKLYYGIDDVVPNPEEYLTCMEMFLFGELALLKVQRHWNSELRRAVAEMGLTHVRMPVIESIFQNEKIHERISSTTM